MDLLFSFYSRPSTVVHIPEGSLLSPSQTAAVCGGNVLTSQRIVDVVLKAFHACAASQGCTKYVFYGLSCLYLTLTIISNLTFGAGGKDEYGKNVSGWGYYEV
jgi:5-oxoprolinase (ATP-hydrolysing)